MTNLILQRLVPLLTSFALFINSVGGLFGVSAVIPYNPERTDVVVSGDVITDIDDILGYYNEAVQKTGFVIGTSSMDVIGTPEVETDFAEEMDASDYWEGIDGMETYIFEVPGEGDILASDVKSAKMSVADGKRAVIINIKDNNDSVSRAFGWTMSLEDAFEMVGLNVTVGEIRQTYTDNTISCIIDDNSGKIIYGDWDSTANTAVTDVTVNVFGEEFNMSMEYTGETHIDI